MKTREFAFTLIELLITIGILAVLATVTVLVVNPTQFFAQARDSRRVSDLQTINTAMKFAVVQGLSEGSASTVYVSIPDTSATCANLGLPTLPAGYAYACATSANYRKVDGTGWVPVAFDQLSVGSPLATLPIDPVNTTSSGHYYTYVTGGSWQLNARLESEKYAETAAMDGGNDMAALEVGSDLELASFTHGLVGYWKLDESSGTVSDFSGYSSNASESGGVTYGTAGKLGTAITFDGSDDYLSLDSATAITVGSNLTIMAWIKTATPQQRPVLSNRQTGGGDIYFGVAGTFFVYGGCSPHANNSNASVNDNTFHHVAYVQNSSGLTVSLYIDGALDKSIAKSSCSSQNLPKARIAHDVSNVGEYFPGVIDEVRVYNRALSATEIAAIYNATR